MDRDEAEGGPVLLVLAWPAFDIPALLSSLQLVPHTCATGFILQRVNRDGEKWTRRRWPPRNSKKKHINAVPWLY